MALREAACSCGQLRVKVEGDPLRVAICHCFACQRRTGSVFGVQARFDRDRLQITGRSREYRRVSDEDDEERTSHFCATCGTTVYFTDGARPDTIGIAIGAFADPEFPQPTISVWEERMHHWVELPSQIRHVH